MRVSTSEFVDLADGLCTQLEINRRFAGYSKQVYKLYN